MLQLRIRAPFGAFRTFTAGSFRPSAPFVTPSAAYGLLLNLAGIESRLDDGESVATQMRADLPRFEMALGALSFPEPQSIFQQLHNYPVGSSGQDHEEVCFGSKYNIQPIRREFLSGIDACIAVRGDGGFESALAEALKSPVSASPVYGIPFLGDNAFLVDRVDLLETSPDAHWYVRLRPEDEGILEGVCRLTVWIDRMDSSKTVAPLFYPEGKKSAEIPDGAWVAVGPPS